VTASGSTLGLGLLLIGVLVAVALWWTTRTLVAADRATAVAGADLDELADQSDEVLLVVAAGGRLEFLSRAAREWIGAPGDGRVDLEQAVAAVKPPESFLGLCASPGSGHFNVNGRPVEAVSHRIPGSESRLLISLSPIPLGRSSAADNAAPPGSSLRMLTEFSAAISSSLDLDEVGSSVAEAITRIVPADILEIDILDSSTQRLKIRVFPEKQGEPKGEPQTEESAFGQSTALLVETRRPIFEESGFPSEASEAPGGRFDFKSYIGIPLLVGDELVGALQVGQLSGARFSAAEFDTVQLLAGQAGPVLRNAVLYEKQRRRAAEADAMANVARAVTAMSEPQELFSHLVESIEPLFDAQMVGFLLYDEAQRILAAQQPFRGLPPNLVGSYRSHIDEGSAAELLILDHQQIVSADAASDDRCQQLGLAGVALAASIRETVLTPLVSSSRMLGYLHVSNGSQPGTGFAQADLAMMQLVAEEAASIIENTRMLWLRGDQVSRSEALQQITQASAAATTLDEGLKQALQPLARLLQADVAVALLFDERLGELLPHDASAVGLPPDRIHAIPPLFVDDLDYSQTVTARQQPQLRSRLGLEAQLLPYYRQVLEGLDIESAAIVPVAARGQGLGELLLGSRHAAHFNQAAVDLLLGAASQLGAMIDAFRLAGETDASLRTRVEQLSAVARVSRQMAAVHSVDRLLDLIHDEAVQLVGADCGSVLLLPPTGNASVPRARFSGCRSGEELSQIEQRALASGQLLSIADFTREEALPPHAGVKSAILVPMVDEGQSIGLLQLHSSRAVAFDAAAHAMAEAMAGQAAAVLVNTSRQEGERREAQILRRRAETLDKLSAAGRSANLDESMDKALAAIAAGIRQSTPFRVVLISLHERETDLLRRVTGAGIGPETLVELRGRGEQYSKLRQLMQPEFQIGNAYYIPAGKVTGPLPDIHYMHPPESSVTRARQNAWHPDDLLLHPLEDAHGQPLGLISLEDPVDALRPDQETVQSLEAFSVQAVQIITNARRMKELRTQLEGLSAALDRQQRLLSVTQNDLPVLLRKDLEQTIALHQVDQRAQRVRGGLAVIEAVSRQADASSALLALARATLTQLGMNAALIAENTPDGPRLGNQLGVAPPTVNVQALFGQRNPLRAALQDGEPILIPDLDESDEWRDTPLLRQLRARGVVCLPFLVEDRPVAALLAVSLAPLPAFSGQDRQVFEQISRQASVVLQNMGLLRQTRGRLHEVNVLLEFSRRLTGLDSIGIANALLDSARQAVKAAQAGVAFTWDEPGDSIVARAASGYADDGRMLRLSYRLGEGLPGRVFAMRQSQVVDAIDFRRDYVLAPEKLVIYREAAGDRVPLSSLLVPIQAEAGGIGLVVLDNFSTRSAFTAQDEALVVSLAQQAALSLENVRLFAETEKLARELEQRVVERTAELTDAQQHTESLLRQEQEEASRSGAILASVADGVVVTAADNRISFVNPSIERILGTRAPEVIGASAEELARLFGETGSAWLETIRHWSIGMPGEHARKTYVERLELDQGRVALVHLAPVMLGDDFLGTVSILRDITHETQVERLKSEFVATVSHELRTPMTSIKGYIEMLMMGAAGPITDGQSQFLDTVKRNVDRLNLLVDGLLDISQLEAGKVALAPEALDLEQIAKEALAELERRSAEDQRPMSFSLDAQSSLPRVLGDRDRVRQVLRSLLDNAYHYTAENGLVQVHLHSAAAGSEVQMDVADTGIGIAASEQERVFERFYRGEDPLVLATPGAGLGLSMAKQLVEMHRGRIWVRSDGIPGRGSTFSVSLPAAVEGSPPGVPTSSDERSGRAADDGSSAS
jgi:PAS domain S-box-containing protein